MKYVILGKAGIIPRGVDRETSEAMHRTHMGVDNDWVSILLYAMRNALSDGWGGSMIATEVSDILFGVPQPNKSTANIGVLQDDKVNIVVHGHNPVVSETVVAACNTPQLLKLAEDKGANDILVLDTGCVSVAHAKAGFKTVEALDQAGPGLKEVCGALGIPPVLHVGSCVDNVRILVLVAALANALGCDISDLPVAGSAPEWYSEKAATIGCYFVASGVFTHLGPMPPVTGSMNVVKLLTDGLEDVVGATFDVEADPQIASRLLIRHIEKKRQALGLDSREACPARSKALPSGRTYLCGWA
jgi:hydroxylamine reductase (hybrid-cluster protein)